MDPFDEITAMIENPPHPVWDAPQLLRRLMIRATRSCTDARAVAAEIEMFESDYDLMIAGAMAVGMEAVQTTPLQDRLRERLAKIRAMCD